MCCFSGTVQHVADTSIFVRLEGEWQYLVYSMTYTVSSEVAMILPIPVKNSGIESALEFINLEDYKDFFHDMRDGFPGPMAATLKAPMTFSTPTSAQFLKVHSVGDFDASYVPNMESFNRLDPRFRIDSEVWENIPEYKNFGFAVFKLKAAPQTLDVQPMALKFKTVDQESLYFPTVHVHDNDFHEYEEFDHTLYCQSEKRLIGWTQSYTESSVFMDVERTNGLITADLPCLKTNLKYKLENIDTWVGSREQYPTPYKPQNFQWKLNL